jgi:hypothetical protein
LHLPTGSSDIGTAHFAPPLKVSRHASGGDIKRRTLYQSRPDVLPIRHAEIVVGGFCPLVVEAGNALGCFGSHGGSP